MRTTILTIFEAFNETDESHELKEFIDRLSEIKNSCPDGTDPRIYFSFDCGYYDEGDSVKVIIDREETAEEISARESAELLESKERESRNAEEIESSERATLAALMAKYGARA